MTKYTVLVASGYQGSGWTIDSFHSTRKDALKRASAIQNPDARSEAYIVAVVGAPLRQRANEFLEFGEIFDTSRVRVRSHHLVGRRVEGSYVHHTHCNIAGDTRIDRDSCEECKTAMEREFGEELA